MEETGFTDQEEVRVTEEETGVTDQEESRVTGLVESTLPEKA